MMNFKITSGRGYRMTAVTLVAILALAGCAASSTSVSRASADHEPKPPAPVGVAIVGDSITAGGCAGSQIIGVGVDVQPCSWAYAVTHQDGFEYAGGWAQAGASSTQMAEGVRPTPSDVVFILAGTNDFHLFVPWDVGRENLATIVDTLGSAHAVLVALPPVDAYAGYGRIAERNLQLAELAAINGWEFVDPWGPYSNQSPYTWADPSFTIGDGVHPSDEVSQAVGSALAEYAAEYATTW